MKKSEMYIKAQTAVLYSSIQPSEKLEILRELMGQEDLARFEEREEGESK